ncbi:IS630 family transposase [Streptomyces sp. NPDC006259]|uniref:IS630 family transposase n=1 Tax=Streptomyces sp. NPDC006259 TaxID=3364740 RepID=UPI003683200E
MEAQVRDYGFSPAQQDEIWRRWREGQSFSLIGRALGAPMQSARRFLYQSGGVRLTPQMRSERHLSGSEREEIPAVSLRGNRPGSWPSGSLDDEDFVIQTATTRPTKLGQPFTRWSLRKLVAYLRKIHGRAIRIGREALGGLLARRGVTFQRTKTWKESPDPQREAKLDRFPDRVFAFDEFGPLGIRPTGGNCWAAQTRPGRVPATYHRTHGVRYFHGCYSVGDDTLWGVNHRKKGAANSLAALKSIRAARPDGAPIYVILDNLSAHKGSDIRRWARKHKVELCFTPTYASWANPIEAHFGPLRQFTIANSHHPNHTVQIRALRAYLRWRNANARHRDVLTAERKERARIRSEKGIRWGGRPLATAA